MLTAPIAQFAWLLPPSALLLALTILSPAEQQVLAGRGSRPIEMPSEW
ncbi:MAG: hypothetical protein P4L90_19380 [Rhodopila sp.]|nr:hypothetical protein [Rhodopila sp.]